MGQPCGINWCMYCVGFHPDERPTEFDMVERMLSPQTIIMRQAARYEHKKRLYRNKVCCLCGRAFDRTGELDETWERTAHMVKAELDDAGVYGVPDYKVKLIVANCRHAVDELFKSIPSLQHAIRVKGYLGEEEAEVFKSLRFAGRLQTIIGAAIEGRRVRMGGAEAHL